LRAEPRITKCPPSQYAMNIDGGGTWLYPLRPITLPPRPLGVQPRHRPKSHPGVVGGEVAGRTTHNQVPTKSICDENRWRGHLVVPASAHNHRPVLRRCCMSSCGVHRPIVRKDLEGVARHPRPCRNARDRRDLGRLVTRGRVERPPPEAVPG